jgi:hypothetical protein
MGENVHPFLPRDQSEATRVTISPGSIRPQQTFALARMLVEWVRASAWVKVAVFVSAAEIWDGSEDLRLASLLRQAHSVFDPLTETPFHVFEDFEAADSMSLVHLAIVSGWEASILAASSGRWVELIRDGAVTLHCPDTATAQSASAYFGAFRPN